MRVISLSRVPSQSFNVVLSGRHCKLSLYWRQERLYLDLAVGAVSVCRGAVCQNRTGILQSPSRDFAGSLHFFDMEGDSPPRWDRLHTGGPLTPEGRWVLVHVEEGEEVPARLRF